jgi:hypothetical protein
MRLEATRGIIQMVSMAITAASTLTFALQSLGYAHIAPYILVTGLLGVPIFAFAYVDLGIFNRKNRENIDRGNNFATPRDKIDDTLIAVGVFAALHGRPPEDDEFEAIEKSIDTYWRDYRDGVDL